MRMMMMMMMMMIQFDLIVDFDLDLDLDPDHSIWLSPAQLSSMSSAAKPKQTAHASVVSLCRYQRHDVL